MKKRLSVDEYLEGLLNSNRVILAKAITLIESTLDSDQLLAEELLDAVVPYTGNSMRIGVSGVPGVGKSTFIESFGNYLIQQSYKVAVLAIDPSSALSKGSILGDKTRMNTLATHPLAFIRPSASRGNLGGVGSKTREAMLLCEAAGYQYIMVETVGVGQSETLVRGMVDFFLLLMLAGAGDELQGIKRGIMELCDALVINKADGDNLPNAKRAAAEYKNALHLFRASQSGWVPKVQTISSIENVGMSSLFEMIQSYQQQGSDSGYFQHNRLSQQESWLNEMIHEELLREFVAFKNSNPIWNEVVEKMNQGKKSVRSAYRTVLDTYKRLDP